MERTVTRTFRDGRSVPNGFEKLRVLWCQTMHGNITWPQRGQYQCKSCGRVYAVPWVAQERRYTPQPVIEISPALEHARTA